MVDLSQSSTHIAMTVDSLRASDHLTILGRWPRLPIVTARASLQLDLIGDDPSAVTSRLLHHVAKWDEAIRGLSSMVSPARRPPLLTAVPRTPSP
jgi:hypothetical protein